MLIMSLAKKRIKSDGAEMSLFCGGYPNLNGHGNCAATRIRPLATTRSLFLLSQLMLSAQHI